LVEATKLRIALVLGDLGRRIPCGKQASIREASCLVALIGMSLSAAACCPEVESVEFDIIGASDSAEIPMVLENTAITVVVRGNDDVYYAEDLTLQLTRANGGDDVSGGSALGWEYVSKYRSRFDYEFWLEGQEPPFGEELQLRLTTCDNAFYCFDDPKTFYSEPFKVIPEAFASSCSWIDADGNPLVGQVEPQSGVRMRAQFPVEAAGAIVRFSRWENDAQFPDLLGHHYVEIGDDGVAEHWLEEPLSCLDDGLFDSTCEFFFEINSGECTSAEVLVNIQ